MGRLGRLLVALALLSVAACGTGSSGSSGSDPTAGAADTGNSTNAAQSAPDPKRPNVDHAVFPGATWQTASPSAVGMDEGKVDAFVQRVGGDGCIVKDGYLVRTWGSWQKKRDWASAGKPVISTLMLFAVKEGKLSGPDALVGSFGWNLKPKDQNMTFFHLANMLSAYARGEIPGQAWAYNDYAIQLYATTLFDRVFLGGSPDEDATAPSRLGALQFEDGSIFGSRGGYGLLASPRDFARIGWFWLNRGYWNGQRLLPWQNFDDYNKPLVPGDTPRSQIDGDDYLGVGTIGGGSDQIPYGPGIYGFNWLFNANVGETDEITWPDAPPDTYQANGHGYQQIVTVIPSLGLVVAADGQWDNGENRFAPGDGTWGMNKNLQLLAEAAPNPAPTMTPAPPAPTPTSAPLTPTNTPPISSTPTPTSTLPIQPAPTSTATRTPGCLLGVTGASCVSDTQCCSSKCIGSPPAPAGFCL